MLVIRRRAGEALLIADNIEIEVLDVGPTQVKLGIRAPKEVLVLRKEIQLIRDQNQVASADVPLTSFSAIINQFRK
jgi:carbon storage regulator